MEDNDVMAVADGLIVRFMACVAERNEDKEALSSLTEDLRKSDVVPVYGTMTESPERVERMFKTFLELTNPVPDPEGRWEWIAIFWPYSEFERACIQRKDDYGSWRLLWEFGEFFGSMKYSVPVLFFRRDKIPELYWSCEQDENPAGLVPDLPLEFRHALSTLYSYSHETLPTV